MKVEVADGLEAVGAAAWGSLHARTALRSPFLGWTWQTEWVRAFAAPRRVEVWRVDDDDGTPVAVLPLYEAAPDRWELVGGEAVSDYLDVVAIAGRAVDAWTALLGARADSTACWELHAVPEASATVTALPALAGAAGLRATATVEERCPVVSLPESWDAYLASLSGKQRHELGRKMRRVEREAPESRAVSVAAVPDVEARLGDFLDLHRRSRTGKARFMDARMEVFFRRIAGALAGAGMVRLWFLDAPGGPLATFMTIEWDGTVGLYNSGFHPDHAALAPGIVLLGHLIRDAIERGMRRFDFLRGDERYKYDLGAAPEAVHRVVIGPGVLP